MFSGEDLVSKPPVQDEASDGRQDARAGGAPLRSSRSASALRRRRLVAGFRSRDPAAVLPPRDRRRLPGVAGGVPRAEQHGTAGARRRTGLARADDASLVCSTDAAGDSLTGCIHPLRHLPGVRRFDLTWICCTASRSTNPRQTGQAEFEQLPTRPYVYL